MEIRPESEIDFEAVREINLAAFEAPTEADLVEALRAESTPVISLVAALPAVVGHIMFSRVSSSEYPGLQMMGLAPMAVLPDHQRTGIGSELVRAGLKKCEDIGTAVVVVLGHPDFYPRFGFKPASHFGISCQYDVPDEVFMAIELLPGALSQKNGTVKYHSMFERL